MDGEGLYKWNDAKGTEYRGAWERGKRHGKGVLTYKDGEYVGDFLNNKRCGIGTCRDPAGKYEGEWRNDMYDGQGTYTWNKTNKDEEITFVGSWNRGNM